MTDRGGPLTRRAFLRTGIAATSVAIAGCDGRPPEEVEPPTERPKITPSPDGSAGIPSPTNRPPTASFTASPNGGLAPVLVELDAVTAVDLGDSIEAYEWSVPSVAVRGETVEVPFEAAGTHRFELTVTNENGASATAEGELTFRHPGVADYPTTGAPVSELVGFEDALLDYMAERRITSAALGIARDGEVVLERGYGWQDRTLTEPTDPDARFRIGSLTKSLAAAVVETLIRTGELSRDDRVFRELPLEALPGETPDSRLFDVTVQHLLDHQGGWDRHETFDPVFADFPIARAMDLEVPPPPRAVVRYMLGRPLQFDPGERTAYSNFGYLVLGVYVETVTGRSYDEVLDRTILAPAGITDIARGRTRPTIRDPREPRYFDPAMGPNVLALDADDLVHLPDGGFHLEKFVAVGDLVASTRGLLSFMDAYWLTGTRRGGGEPYYFASGSQPGMYSMAFQFPGGIDVAVLFNRRGDASGAFADIRGVIERAVDDVETWP